MIGSLRGVLLDRVSRAGQSDEVIVEVQGVGYRVIVPTSTSVRLGPLGTAVFLHIHTHVREDALLLYGFSAREERTCFEILIGSHGVGPAVALALLSVHSPAALQKAVEADDADALMLVPGIGRKTATRLLIELKSRLDMDDSDLTLVGTAGGEQPGDGVGASRADVRAALAGLGYGADEIRHVMAELPTDASLEDQVRHALRRLAASR